MTHGCREEEGLEAKGWRVGSAAAFLGLSDAEAELVDIKVKVARALQHRREKAGLTQAELAKRLKTSQPRVANMLAAKDVSLDLLVRSLLVLGADAADIAAVVGHSKRRRRAT